MNTLVLESIYVLYIYPWGYLSKRIQHRCKKSMYLPPPLLRGQSHGLQPLPVKWKFHLKAGQSAVLWIFIEILGSSNHSPQIYYSRGWLKHRSPSGSSSCLACLGLKCINFLNHLNGHSGWQVDVAPTCPNNHMYMCTCVHVYRCAHHLKILG